MTVNNNIIRIYDAATLESPDYYIQQKAFDDRIEMVPDPVGQRGQVVKIRLEQGDPLVQGSHRSEIVRDKYGAEYALGTGGGWYWFSYMLDPIFKQTYQFFEASNPFATDYSVLIQQYHARNTDPYLHPKWYIAFSEYGLTLNKFAQSDIAHTYERVATWPLDSLVWHDVVTYIYWSTGADGVYRLYIDNRLIYEFYGPTIFPLATLGGYWKQGIYAPGTLPPSVPYLQLYVQGFRQVYPANGTYEECTGVPSIAPAYPKLTLPFLRRK